MDHSNQPSNDDYKYNADGNASDSATHQRIRQTLWAFLNPKLFLHAIKVLRFYSYSHVAPRARLTLGKGSAMAPNVSLRNGERITIGRECHIGERASLWAGDDFGSITIGNNVSLAPEVYITASDYQFVEGVPFRQQPKRERHVNIGNDVWLGVRVVVTAGVTIADGCIVGAGAVVTKDLPPNTIAAGIPAKVIKERP